ncbi:nitrite reductase large subunit NirB [Cohnella thailandensis]|uniref:NAD(P)/FAD-dependent oxidoreductase n=1 Tax=Cohnella thailandensis TaxID=557557 RepID=A0A841T597_9BACL|nr:nitrite reductase large subunit NirB [Cohnella thailandensis]MBB6637488.1 NAD(P)/FAD-dependent oxidoreductase [Cohnella thailandensis]MBP1977521.1 nitrite reductase (NADH) large subunit [Cohnella thailandensis]
MADLSNHRRKLILIGNGMAGINTLEQILKLTNSFDIAVYGEEPYPNYNRIQLSYVLEGSKRIDEIILNDRNWYEDNGIELHTGTKVVRIDPDAKKIFTSEGDCADYDALIIATGSKPFVLPVPGATQQGVVGFRDIADCHAMIEASKRVKRAAVIGGGLLGLEAAKGLVQLGMETTVVHLMDKLMERQLDQAAAGMLKAELERQGIRFLMKAKTTEVLGDGEATGLRFEDGTELEAQLVVMAAGIVPNVELARASGIEVGRGIVVDDFMRTSAPDVYAVGECCEHRGIAYGLVAPLFEQGAVLAKHLAGAETAPYAGSSVSTKLKISGVDVFSAGEYEEEPGHRVLRRQDDWLGLYKKVLLRGNQIVGAVLYGDVTDAPQLAKLIREGAEMTDELYGRLFGSGQECAGGASKGAAAVLSMKDDEIVCGCNGVTKGDIVRVIQVDGLTTVDEIKVRTGATRSCGGCKPLVEQLLQVVLGDGYRERTAPKKGICGCTTHDSEEIVAAIREKRLTSVREVMAVMGWSEPEGCSKCRPALNYYLGMIWPTEHEDERDSRFVNERLHANIQKDGTFSVIPRMYGGVTSPEQLRRIAEVAEKYNVKMVKVTGGQRIDLLGVEKKDLPAIWEDLDLPSGYGYAKALRTVKTCVGARFCRFGTQDSIAMGIRLEKKFERLWMPAKFKMAVNGCPRNCAESGTKDLGIVGNDGGWEIFVGGNGGIKTTVAASLCKVKTDEELMDVCGAFIQYYRETGHYAERTSEWLERVGIDNVRDAVLHKPEVRKLLLDRVELALAEGKDPWREAFSDESLRRDYYQSVEADAR